MSQNARVAAMDNLLTAIDPEILEAIKGERSRQEDQIELIASENYASQRVMAAQGGVRMLLSVSDERDYAVAYAVLWGAAG